MIFSSLPILLVDMIGSVAMVVIALLALNKARQLRELDTDNAIFLYLLWISMGFTIFAVSRSLSHILKQFLILTANLDVWQAISPYTGAVNTVSFMLVGLITLFFNQSWKINEKVLTSRRRMELTHIKLKSLNQTLEQKVVERTEMLTSSEHRARRIFEQSLDTIIMTDDTFWISQINQAGLTLTGHQKGGVVGKMAMADVMAHDGEWQRIRDMLHDHEFVLNEETDFLRQDGSQVRVLITAGVDYGAFGCKKTFHFIIKDINEKKQMEKQIAQADKLAALGELSAGVAHEINNPLGIILGYTQLMLKEKTGVEDDLKTIEKHVKNCKEVVSDLLSFSRKGSKEMGVLDLHKVVGGVVKFLRNHSDFRKADIRVSLPDNGPVTVRGNAQELTQVMINLMINACHAIEDSGGGTIEVTVALSGGEQVIMAVKDNGSGIPKEHLSRIFDPFFTTKPVGRGTGLGLSVGYGIIRRHGGTITARNRKKGGAAFDICLPLEDQRISPEKEA